MSRATAAAEFITEKDRRIYTFAQAAVRPLGVDVDEACRRYAELQRRLKEGTLEEAVDFKNAHALRVRLDANTKEVFEAYLAEMEKRGVSDYHFRDVKRYVGNFVKAYLGLINGILTIDIDTFLASRGGKARNKNNHRDAIIAFFTFGQKKGFLPRNLPHAAEDTTEFRDPREKIKNQEQVMEMLQPDDIYLPEEMRRLLVAAKDENALRATMEVKAFSGVRTEEIVRLWWPMIEETKKCISVPDAVGKIDSRRIPLLPNLQERVAAYPSGKQRIRYTTPGSGFAKKRE